MKYQHLHAYIEDRNRWSKFTGRPLLSVDTLTQAQAEMLYQSLDADLSPENLTCDGELRGAALQRRAKMFKGALADLRALGFHEPDNMWNI